MNKDDKWVDRFRKRMSDYREPIPENLWTELEKELERPKLVPIYYRYIAVAAVAIIAVLSSVVLWWMNSSSPEYIKDVSNTIAEVKPLQIFKTDTPIKGERNVVVGQYVNKHKLVARTNVSPVDSLSLKVTVSEKETILNPRDSEKLRMEQHSDLEEEEIGSQPFFPTRDTFHDSSMKKYHKLTDKKDNQVWELSLSLGNMPGVSKNGAGYANLQGRKITMLASIIEADKFMTEQTTPIVGAYNVLVANNVDKDVQSKAEHKMPITMGISLRKNLTERWAFESGIIYTQLLSELRSGTERNYYETEQKLHYVGIPLKGIYRLWENNLLAVYISAGGAVEKCVSGSQNTTCVIDDMNKGSEKVDVKVKELQWSVSSSVGAQVKLIRNMGVYLEPGVNYYFKDGNDIQTIRKEHPFNFNLQMGVRFSF